MSTTYIIRALKIAVLPKGEPTFSERATFIEIVDDGGGEFLRLSQTGGHTDNEKAIVFDADEWPHIKAGVEQMLADIKVHQKD